MANKKGQIRVFFNGQWQLFDAKVELYVNDELHSTHSYKQGFQIELPVKSHELKISLLLGGMRQTDYEITKLGTDKAYWIELKVDWLGAFSKLCYVSHKHLEVVSSQKVINKPKFAGYVGVIALVILLFLSPFYINIDSCNDMQGDFVDFHLGIRSSRITTYKFDYDNSVVCLNGTKRGEGDYKFLPSMKGKYKVQDGTLIMNFGGSDIIMRISRDFDGCIKSISNEDGTYTRDKYE